MKITPDMPKEAGGTVETHGALLELADFTDDDGTGIKATVESWPHRIRIKVDSFDPFGKTIWLCGRDAYDLGQRLIELSAGLVDDTEAYEGRRCRG